MSTIRPVIIKKNNLRTLNCMSGDIVQEDIIYKATPNDFLDGKYPNLVITNKLNKLNNSSQTRASFSSSNSSVVELTSDAVTEVIGQKNYNLVLTALCSVINQDLKIKALLSLLTTKKEVNNDKLTRYNVSTQTEQTCMTLLMKEKQRRNRRSRVVKPYVVTDQLTKVIVHPKQVKNNVTLNKNQVKRELCEQEWPDLKLVDEELSNASWGSMGNLSILSDNIPNKVLDPHFMMNNIDKHTEDLTDHDTSMTSINVSDNLSTQGQSSTPLSREVEHKFDNTLQLMSSEEKHKLIIQQALVDFKTCIQRDEDDNLPIHRAVLDDNVSLLKRHCMMLSKREESIDELSGSNFTALQMSIFHNSVQCMEILLAFGADVFVTDDDGRTCFHLAAEKDTDHLKLLLEHCKKNSMSVIKQNEHLWSVSCDRQNNEKICEYLLHSISIMCDLQGYTPLMLASKSGVAKNVKLLVEISPDTINMGMPNSGNTALYLAVAAACLDAQDHDDQSVVSENYLKTVETLIVNGGDPYLQNSSGSNVNDLLSDSQGANRPGYINVLSLLIANELTSIKHFKGNVVKNFEKHMLIRNTDGDISIADINKRKTDRLKDTPKVCVTKDNNTSAVSSDVASQVVQTAPSDTRPQVKITNDAAKIVTLLPMVKVNHVVAESLKKNETVVVRPIMMYKDKAQPKVYIPKHKRKLNQTENLKATGEDAGKPKSIRPKGMKLNNMKLKPTPECVAPPSNTNYNNGQLKFVKILPKPVFHETVTTTKRLSNDVQLIISKRVRKISENT